MSQSFDSLVGLDASDCQDEERNGGDRGANSSLGETSTLPSYQYDATSRFSLDDTMSIDSETLQDFGSLVSLPPGTLAGLFQSRPNTDDGGHTIVSSAPSGVLIPPPEASQEVFAISPHPQLVAGPVRSIATVCSETMSFHLLQDATSLSDDDESGDTSVESREYDSFSSTSTPLNAATSTGSAPTRALQ